MNKLKSLNNKMIVFLCGSRDYHAMDWYRSSLELLPNNNICILTDLIQSEGVKKLIIPTDNVYKLIIIDRLLFKKQSKLGNIWRNLIKLIVFPLQIVILKIFSFRYPEAIFHAHSMYYLFLAWAANINYIGTPQGSDVLVKPFKSKLYKFFSIKSLKSAKTITVDSINMRDRVKELSGKESIIIQNGIDIESIIKYKEEIKSNKIKRVKNVSMRGITPLYRIQDIIKSRNNIDVDLNIPLTFIYPFSDNQYRNEVFKSLKSFDEDLGRVDRNKMYELFIQTKIAFSIPISDSSPRSVYEAIFCGSIVAITYNSYYDNLPLCMKSRIIIVDLHEKDWFKKAVDKAANLNNITFKPSIDALEIFDQKKSFKKMASLYI